jgi:hypothetical protein
MLSIIIEVSAPATNGFSNITDIERVPEGTVQLPETGLNVVSFAGEIGVDVPRSVDPSENAKYIMP